MNEADRMEPGPAVFAQSHRAQVILALSALGGYGLMFFPTYHWMGRAATALAVVPVAAIGWMLGMRGGLLAALFCLLLNIILLNLVGQPGWEVLTQTGGGALGSMLLVLIGGVVGRMSDLGRRAARALVARQEAEEMLERLRHQNQLILNSAGEGIYGLDLKGRTIFVNPAAARMLGWEAEELIGQPMHDILHHSKPDGSPYPREECPIYAAFRDGATHRVADEVFWKKDGTSFPIAYVSTPIRERNEIVGAVVVFEDITERQEAEEELVKLRQAVESSGEVIFLTDREGIITYVNPEFTRLYGHTAEEVVGRVTPRILRSGRMKPVDYEWFWQTILNKQVVKGELVNKTKDGRFITIEGSASSILDEGGNIIGFLAIQRDITERKQTEESLHEERQLFIGGTMVVFKWKAAAGWPVEYVSPNVRNQFGYAPEELTCEKFRYGAIVHPDDLARVAKEVNAHTQAGVPCFEQEYRIARADGECRWIYDFTVPVRDERGEIRRYHGYVLDITERKQAEEALRESEANLNRAQSVANTGSWHLDIRRNILSWSAETYRIFGVPADMPLRYESFLTCVHPEDREFVDRSWQAAVQGARYDIEHRIVVNDQVKWVRERAEFELDANGLVRGGIGTVQDITERKRVEEERARLLQETHQRAKELETLAEVASALRTARTVEEMLPLLVRKAAEAVGGAAGSIFLVEPETGDLVSRGWLAASDEWRFTSDASLTLRHRRGEGVTGHVAATGEIYITRDLPHDPLSVFLPGEVERLRSIHSGISLPLRTQERIVGVLHIWRHEDRGFGETEVRLLTSIAEMAGNALHRAALHEQTEQRLQRLTALRAVDTAITASPDLHLTLNVLLNQVTAQLRVDAADILLLNPHSERLEYAAGRGFRTAALQATRLRLGEGYAGRAALERRIVHIPDLRTRHTDFLRSPLFATEAFISTYCVPLITKAEVKGVLEIFHRASLVPDPEWLNFLESMAVQAAIAIDNAELFDGLRRSNVELGLAYDATLEGWARALELRDKETEGHTQRVTEMTLRLAEVVGLSNEQTVHVRRGALLHDMGKMGIPDSILLKPDKLTDDEWVIMKKHPQYAYEMLSPIVYLQKALDIPYCHHEKWDGSGYPRGLKGEQIPLAARIFTVVDVWDALRSDRPYRSGWSDEKVREYILEQSGKYFDPQVVEVFLRLVQSQP